MLSSRWNQIKDPEARETCRLFEQAINTLGNIIGFDPLPSQQNNVSVLGNPLKPPAPPLTITVTSISGGVLVQITANPANILPVQYFVETSASASFTNVTTYRISSTLSDTINVGTATLFYRCRCQSFNSAFSDYTLFGNPTSVTGGSAALGTTTGSGAVVLQNSPTIITPTIAQINSLDLTTAGTGDRVTLLDRQDAGTAITGNGTDLTLYSFTVPAGKMAAGKGIRVTLQYQHTTGTQAATIKLSIGGTAIANYSTTTNQPGNQASLWSFTFWNNQGSTTANSYEDQNIVETNTLLFGPRQIGTAINMGNAQTVLLTFNVAAADQFTFMGGQTELIQ
jgi:hypothetical protein